MFCAFAVLHVLYSNLVDASVSRPHLACNVVQFKDNSKIARSLSESQFLQPKLFTQNRNLRNTEREHQNKSKRQQPSRSHWDHWFQRHRHPSHPSRVHPVVDLVSASSTPTSWTSGSGSGNGNSKSDVGENEIGREQQRWQEAASWSSSSSSSSVYRGYGRSSSANQGQSGQSLRRLQQAHQKQLPQSASATHGGQGGGAQAQGHIVGKDNTSSLNFDHVVGKILDTYTVGKASSGGASSMNNRIYKQDSNQEPLKLSSNINIE